MKPSGVFINHGTFHESNDIEQGEWTPVFNVQITESIENCTVVAASDASCKDGIIGGH